MEEHRRSKEVTGVQRGNTTTAITKARGVGTAKDTVLDNEGNKVIHDTPKKARMNETVKGSGGLTKTSIELNS